MTLCFIVIPLFGYYVVSLFGNYVIPQLDWGIYLKRKGIRFGMPCLLNLVIHTLDVGIFTHRLPEQARQ